MAQIMKRQAGNAGGVTDPLEGLADGIRPQAPDPTVDAARQRLQDLNGHRRQRHPAGRVVLGPRCEQNVRLAVHMVPAHAHDLAAAQGGGDRETDDRRNLPAVRLGGHEETCLFIVLQSTFPAPGQLRTLGADEIHRIAQRFHAPGGTGDVVEMGQDREIESDRISA